LNFKKNILPQNGEVFYFPQLFNKEECRYLLNAFENEIIWKHETIKIFGKNILQPRLTALYGYENKPYSYSGNTMIPIDFTPTLLMIKNRIETIAKVNFTTVLLNNYRNGNDSMGWHSDNEKELGKNPIIASVSFGAERMFKLKHKLNKDLKQHILLENGSLLLMQGETQHYWQHAIAKTTKPLNSRINLTFRVIV